MTIRILTPEDHWNWFKCSSCEQKFKNDGKTNMLYIFKNDTTSKICKECTLGLGVEIGGTQEEFKQAMKNKIVTVLTKVKVLDKLK